MLTQSSIAFSIYSDNESDTVKEITSQIEEYLVTLSSITSVFEGKEDKVTKYQSL